MDLIDTLFEQRREKKEEKIEQKPKKPSPFEYHNQFFKGTLLKEDYNKINEYLFLIHLSNEPKIIEELNNLNLVSIPIEKLIPILKLILKFKKVGYIKYPKKPQIKNEKYLESVKWYFKINDNVARRYLSKLSKEELKNIEEAYKASL